MEGRVQGVVCQQCARTAGRFPLAAMPLNASCAHTLSVRSALCVYAVLVNCLVYHVGVCDGIYLCLTGRDESCCRCSNGATHCHSPNNLTEHMSQRHGISEPHAACTGATSARTQWCIARSHARTSIAICVLRIPCSKAARRCRSSRARPGYAAPPVERHRHRTHLHTIA